jgi:hypothetical protein
MPDTGSSITAIKTSFFATQVKLLNRPLQLLGETDVLQNIPSRELKNALKQGSQTSPKSSRLILTSKSQSSTTSSQ